MKTVAVLDDDASLIELYENILQDEGYRVAPIALTRDLPRMLDSLNASQARMLILDVHLPGVDSFHLVRSIAICPSLSYIKILICSASRPSLAALGERLEKEGIAFPRTLDKPFDLDDLLKEVKFLIGSSN